MSLNCFDKEQDIPNMHEKLRKSQSITEWYRCCKWGVMNTNGKCLSCGIVDIFGYFQLH